MMLVLRWLIKPWAMLSAAPFTGGSHIHGSSFCFSSNAVKSVASFSASAISAVNSIQVKRLLHRPSYNFKHTAMQFRSLMPSSVPLSLQSCRDIGSNKLRAMAWSILWDCQNLTSLKLFVCEQIIHHRLRCPSVWRSRKRYCELLFTADWSASSRRIHTSYILLMWGSQCQRQEGRESQNSFGPIWDSTHFCFGAFWISGRQPCLLLLSIICGFCLGRSFTIPVTLFRDYILIYKHHSQVKLALGENVIATHHAIICFHIHGLYYCGSRQSNNRAHAACAGCSAIFLRDRAVRAFL